VDTRSCSSGRSRPEDTKLNIDDDNGGDDDDDDDAEYSPSFMKSTVLCIMGSREFYIDCPETENSPFCRAQIGDRGGTVVKVLCYKSEGRLFDSRWCHWNFSFT
jgi:hypothetical protein